MVKLEGEERLGDLDKGHAAIWYFGSEFKARSMPPVSDLFPLCLAHLLWTAISLKDKMQHQANPGLKGY